MPSKLPVEPQVDMKCLAACPGVEQVLAMSFDSLDSLPVQLIRLFEPPLRRRHCKFLLEIPFGLIAGDAMDGMAFRHRNSIRLQAMVLRSR